MDRKTARTLRKSAAAKGVGQHEAKRDFLSLSSEDRHRVRRHLIPRKWTPDERARRDRALNILRARIAKDGPDPGPLPDSMDPALRRVLTGQRRP